MDMFSISKLTTSKYRKESRKIPKYRIKILLRNNTEMLGICEFSLPEYKKLSQNVRIIFDIIKKDHVNLSNELN